MRLNEKTLRQQLRTLEEEGFKPVEVLGLAPKHLDAQSYVLSTQDLVDSNMLKNATLLALAIPLMGLSSLGAHMIEGDTFILAGCSCGRHLMAFNVKDPDASVKQIEKELIVSEALEKATLSSVIN